jgi:hypothetical protein
MADLIPRCNKNPVPKWQLTFPLSQKKVYLSAGWLESLSYLTSCTATRSNLQFANFLLLFSLPYRDSQHSMSKISYPFSIARLFQRICTILMPCVAFHKRLDFYSKLLLAPCPTLKLEDHPLLIICDSLFNIFTAILHTWRPYLTSTIRGRHAVFIWYNATQTFEGTDLFQYFVIDANLSPNRAFN